MRMHEVSPTMAAGRDRAGAHRIFAVTAAEPHGDSSADKWVENGK